MSVAAAAVVVWRAQADVVLADVITLGSVLSLKVERWPRGMEPRTQPQATQQATTQATTQATETSTNPTFNRNK
jgi:hypothetical protein